MLLLSREGGGNGPMKPGNRLTDVSVKHGANSYKMMESF